MSSNETEISFLNKYFIFKKIKDVDTKKIVLDTQETETEVDDQEEKGIIKLKKKNKCYIYIVLHNHINIFFYLLLVDVILFIATYFRSA